MFQVLALSVVIPGSLQRTATGLHTLQLQLHVPPPGFDMVYLKRRAEAQALEGK